MARSTTPAVLLPLRLDPEQRFTCSQCGRCCRRPWEIVVTAAEAEALRAAGAERFYRESEDSAEGAVRDPFEPIPRALRFQRIRKRADGACGFLSPQGRCRLHEELGAVKKPLTCRMFPYRFHPLAEEVLVTTSFCCPTTTANGGERIAAQEREIKALRAEWFSVYPEKPRAARLVSRRPLSPAALRTLKEVLRAMLVRPGADGASDLRANVARMARTLEDLSRWRVVRLPGESFDEYLALTGRFAAESDKPAARRRASLVGRLLARGFLFLVVAARLQVENRRASGLKLGLRLRLFRLLAHFHGLAPGASGVDLRALSRASVAFDTPELRALGQHYLRASIEGLGTGRRPVLEELALSVSYLNAACALAVMRADREGRPVDGAMLSDALMEAVDLTHADDRGLLSRVMRLLSGGVESLYVFSEGATSRAR
jgi:Fe-S-cluster containining protein